ncbi:hypothetical protein EJ02DRAFT_455873, partial [Clathrospora elynae]
IKPVSLRAPYPLPTRSALFPPHSRALLHAGAPQGGCSAIHEDSKNGQLAPLNSS